MRIISKHKDYYDYLGQIYGIDGKVVYKRKASEFDEGLIHNPDISFRTTERYEPTYIFHFLAIWFCNEYHPLVEVVRKWSVDGMYDTRESVKYYYTHKALSSLRGLLGWNERTDEKIRSHFASTSNKKLNTKYDSPQLVVGDFKGQADVILKDYSFQQVYSPEQAFQKVSMFVAAKPDVPQTCPTDMHRFEAKGFDKRTSFRRM